MRGARCVPLAPTDQWAELVAWTSVLRTFPRRMTTSAQTVLHAAASATYAETLAACLLPLLCRHTMQEMAKQLLSSQNVAVTTGSLLSNSARHPMKRSGVCQQLQENGISSLHA